MAQPFVPQRVTHALAPPGRQADVRDYCDRTPGELGVGAGAQE
jgi:hypothetical protein